LPEVTISHLFFCPCPPGLEQVLAQEIAAIAQRPNVKQLNCALQVLKVLPSGVQFSGTLKACWAVNLYSRIANRVLLQIRQGSYTNEQSIYDLTTGVAWEQFFSTKHTFRVKLNAHHSSLTSLHFAGLRIKDAVCDRFRQCYQERPSIDTTQPDMCIYAYLYKQEITLYLDTSGEALFKRGWRSDKGHAPIKENLAAGILYLTAWQAEQPLFDPMCGSGTFLIEAAHIALDKPPGHMRAFAFEKLLSFKPKEWQVFRQQALDQVNTTRQLKIAGSDISGDMVALTQANWQRAGLPGTITVKQVDANAIQPPFDMPGMMILNPPYGERISLRGQNKAHQSSIQHSLEQDTSLEDSFAAAFATQLKQHFAGWQVYIFSGDLKLPKRMRLKESQRTPLFNGAIECRLFRFQMVAGSARPKKINQQPRVC
jgi:putative N6-adenine-specific DNA methylase